VGDHPVGVDHAVGQHAHRRREGVEHRHRPEDGVLVVVHAKRRDGDPVALRSDAEDQQAPAAVKGIECRFSGGGNAGSLDDVLIAVTALRNELRSVGCDVVCAEGGGHLATGGVRVDDVDDRGARLPEGLEEQLADRAAADDERV
jgi:hypothetical protein